jgi:prepilin-type processing-associated H-X9-DG protein
MTMIEVLAALGIVTILVGITVPVLSRVRESGRATTCLNNLRQLGSAFLSYATDNNGRFPRPAAFNQLPLPAMLPEDWIHWMPGFDPDKGAIVPYMGGKFVAAHYTCPSDNVELHPSFSTGRHYAYSYSVNEMICGSTVRARRPIQLQQIVCASEKILLIDEASETLDDGCWAWQDYKGAEFNILANRHSRKTEDIAETEHGEGNVCFADGHAGILPRKDTFTAHYYDPFVR